MIGVKLGILTWEIAGAVIYMVFFSEMTFYGEKYKPKEEVSQYSPQLLKSVKL